MDRLHGFFLLGEAIKKPTLISFFYPQTIITVNHVNLSHKTIVF